MSTAFPDFRCMLKPITAALTAVFRYLVQNYLCRTVHLWATFPECFARRFVRSTNNAGQEKNVATRTLVICHQLHNIIQHGHCDGVQLRATLDYERPQSGPVGSQQVINIDELSRSQ